MSQIVNYEDPELEQLAIFARYLQPLLRRELVEDDQVGLSGLELTHYRITKQKEHRLPLGEEEGDYRIKPPEPGDGTAKDPEKEEPSEIIEKLNELFGAETTDQDKVSWFNSVREKLRENNSVMVRALRANPREQVLHGDFPQALENAVLDSMSGHNELAQEALEDPGIQNQLMRMLLEKLGKEIKGGRGATT